MAQLQAPERIRAAERTGRPGRVVGGFFLFTGGIHLGIVAAGPEFYRHFADGALLPFITAAWRDVFMANPAAWGLALSLGEVALGLLLLRGGPWATVGWAGVTAFHLGLMLFGWGFWLWSVPALAFLVPSAVAHWRRQHQPVERGVR
ncbi:hypothetical protein [Pseudarthrobacter sp. ATCC 49987]|uniref:hypothetical protein n=1 Tax=Pseudarthrobacter sp. ATCC 49987 TaxID=2698204 RepID=UPI00192453DE|nr:hypothetical protein [Pseudarthrobacter sp. ATCC 49987]